VNEILSEEQQQIETIKNWIKDNLLVIVAVAVVCSAVVFGPGAYQGYKNSKIFPSSDAYEQFNAAVEQASSGTVSTDAELQRVDDLTDMLVEQHGDTHYAFLASLKAAKLSADIGNYSVALSRLNWAKENATSEADQYLVNYRLALVEAQLGNSSKALDLLSESNEHFSALYGEARGDIYKANGQRDQAISAYRDALESLDETNTVQQATIDLKLSHLETGLGAISE